MQLKLRTKLLLGFTLVASGAAVVGGFGLTANAQIERADRLVNESVLPSMRALGQIEQSLTAIRFFTARAQYFSVKRSAMAIEDMWGQREQARRRAEEGLALLHKTQTSAEAEALLKNVESGFREYMMASDQLWQALRDFDEVLGDDLQVSLAAKAKSRLVEPLSQLTEWQSKTARTAQTDAIGAAASARKVLWTALALTFVVAVGIGTALATSIYRKLQQVVIEANRIRDGIIAGRLELRADAARLDPELQPIASAINEIVEAFVKPIQVTAEYVNRISKGDIPPKITDVYEGDFDLIKQSLNRCIEAVGILVDEVGVVIEAGAEGDLSRRATTDHSSGVYRKLLRGVNDTLDAVLGPINEASAVLDKLANRNLTARVQGSYRGDHARIKEALNTTAQALHHAMAQVAQTVEQVSSASGQIASSSQAVASGASEQAAALEETSSSLESMASTTQEAAESAQEANVLAQQARTAATEGSSTVEQMTDAMGKIKSAAEATSQIIKDINEISFQTNLLALNAAVEAARAGEAGRGFAVVAEEVRSLALRSKEAATKTEDLIRQSVSEAGAGEVTAKHVQEKLADIAQSVGKVTEIVAEIAAAAREQATGIGQVSKAMEQMNQVTQQNAASSEESSSAATELSGQAQELAALIATFQCEVAEVAPQPIAQVPGAHSPNRRSGTNGAQTVPPIRLVYHRDDTAVHQF